MTDTDVLVVGAGPTGLTLAGTLALRGVAATVVDALPAGRNTSRAAAVNARTLEVLEELDVSRRMVKEGLTAPRFSMRDRRTALITIDFSGLPTAYPYTLMLSQATTERLLVERLDELGVQVRRPVGLTGLAQDGNGVTATFDDGQTLRARYVVGADGIHSTVREQAGIGFTGGEYAESFVLADVHLEGEAPVDEVILFYAATGLTVVAPLPHGIHRIVAPLDHSPEQPSASFVQELLDTRGYGPGLSRVADVVWGSRFRIHHRVADTYRAGRVVLAGDAAHVHSPAGGQGMNLGIQDAVALSAALTAALGGDDTAVDTYSEHRRPIAQQVLTLTGRLTRVATLPAPVRPLRNTLMRLAGAMPPVRDGLAPRLSGLVYR